MKANPIDKVTEIDPEIFFRDYVKKNRLIVIEGFAKNWPAMKSWNFEYFKEMGKHKNVEVEIGNSNQHKTLRKTVNLSEYISLLLEIGEMHSINFPFPYLNVFDIQKHFPNLVQQLDFSIWPNKQYFISGWIGPKGTYTGLHFDRCHGLYVQICGKKSFRFYSPNFERGSCTHDPCFYKSDKWDYGSILSRVDSRTPDYDRYPLFKKVKKLQVDLNHGDLLFIPSGWWHDVSGLSPSIAVSCFCLEGKWQEYVKETIEVFKYFFHSLGLYARRNCTCHSLNRDVKI